MSRLLEALKQRVLLSDGAMGTQLQLAGLEPGGCGEAWNITHPDRVLAIQRRYVDAGSDCLITNTFGGCRIMLDRHDQGEQTAAINEAAVRIGGERPQQGVDLGELGACTRRGAVGGDAVEIDGIGGPPQAEHAHQSSAAEPRAHGVDDDASEPALERAGIAQGRERVERLDERVVHDVFDVVGRSGDARGQVEREGCMAPIEVLGGAVVALHRQRHELLVIELGDGPRRLRRT